MHEQHIAVNFNNLLIKYTIKQFALVRLITSCEHFVLLYKHSVEGIDGAIVELYRKEKK